MLLGSFGMRLRPRTCVWSHHFFVTSSATPSAPQHQPRLAHPDRLRLAHAAYEERIMPSGELDPARLAVLSDALEEAGCDNADILDHLRTSGSARPRMLGGRSDSGQGVTPFDPLTP